MSVDFLADAATVSEPDAMRQELIMEYVDALFRGWQRVSPVLCRSPVLRHNGLALVPGRILPTQDQSDTEKVVGEEMLIDFVIYSGENKPGGRAS